MAYNHNKNIVIVDTQNWAVKKTLTDEQVSIFVENINHFEIFEIYTFILLKNVLAEQIELQRVFILEMWKIYCCWR